MNPAWVDSHCHLQREHGRGLDADAAVARAITAGVGWLVCVGTDLATSLEAIGLAERHAEVYATVGLHPHEAARLDDEWEALVALIDHPRVVGIGETGFDFHYVHSPAEAQERAFRAQVGLAQRSGLALVVHTRDAWDDTFAVLHDTGTPTRTVFHCFTGGEDEARRALALDAYLSFSGIVSFPAATDVRAAARVTPPERVLVETDAPYLAPVPHRGKPNEPALVGVVGEALAAARGERPEQTAVLTRDNATRVFRASSVNEPE